MAGNWVNQIMEINECTCEGHQVLSGSVELLYCTAKTNIILYINTLEFKYLRINKCK